MRLGVTRTAGMLADLTKMARERRIEVVPIPLVWQKPIEFDWPHGLDSDKIDWLFFGSANGVNSFFDRTELLGISFPLSVKIGCVGDRTADALSKYGRKPALMPAESYGEEMFNDYIRSAAVSGQTVVNARAAAVNFDPITILSEAGVRYYPIVCYETIVQALDKRLIEPFETGDFILFTAPSTVQAFQNQFGRPVAKPIAIGHSTATAMSDAGWYGFVTMRKADVGKVLEYI